MTTEAHNGILELAFDASQLSMEEATHVYRNADVVIPSVTGILVGTGIVETQWFTEQGKWRGSDVHEAAWFDDENDLDDSSLTEEVLGHVEGWRKFKRDTGFQSILIEQRVYHATLGYAGTPDRVGLMHGKPCLPDLKSGASSKATRFQTVGYAACFKKPRMFTRMEVRTKKNGDYTLQVYSPQEYARDFAAWQNLVAVYNLKRELKLL